MKSQPRTYIICLAVLVFCTTARLPAQEALTPQAALTRLKEGNTRFAADKPTTRDVTQKRRDEVAKGQHPFAVILTCADSRVSPELVFDQGLGDVFVVRVAGNVTDPAILGSIEYAVEHLKAPLIVVLGHESCGAVKAVIEKSHVEGNLEKLLKEVHVDDKLPEDKDQALAAGIKTNALFHAKQLTAQSPLIKDFVDHDRVQIAAGVYSLKSGKVDWLEPQKGSK
jgi:carbonic anhydrase